MLLCATPNVYTHVCRAVWFAGFSGRIAEIGTYNELLASPQSLLRNLVNTHNEETKAVTDESDASGVENVEGAAARARAASNGSVDSASSGEGKADKYGSHARGLMCLVAEMLTVVVWVALQRCEGQARAEGGHGARKGVLRRVSGVRKGPRWLQRRCRHHRAVHGVAGTLARCADDLSEASDRVCFAVCCACGWLF